MQIAEASLNAPYGARCFPTARRVAPTVTSRNATPDRQGPRKHPPDPQAHGQNSRVFVANPHIATDAPRQHTRPGKADRHRRVAASNCALHNALTTEQRSDRRAARSPLEKRHETHPRGPPPLPLPRASPRNHAQASPRATANATTPTSPWGDGPPTDGRQTTDDRQPTAGHAAALPLSSQSNAEPTDAPRRSLLFHRRQAAHRALGEHALHDTRQARRHLAAAHRQEAHARPR